MKKINAWLIFITICTMGMLFLSGCESNSNNNDFNEVSMKEYYKIEDFQSITIGESTYQDVCKIASSKSIQMTSYGCFCEYPMQSGGYIRIKFYGPDLVVGDIQEVFLSKK